MLNPRVSFNMTVGRAAAGGIVMELFTNVIPRTAENFRILCTGEKVCIIPLDTAEIRMQLLKKVVGDTGPKYRGMLDTAATIGREEGLAAL